MTKRSETAPLRYSEQQQIKMTFALLDQYQARRRYRALFWLAAGLGITLGVLIMVGVV